MVFMADSICEKEIPSNEDNACLAFEPYYYMFVLLHTSPLSNDKGFRTFLINRQLPG